MAMSRRYLARILFASSVASLIVACEAPKPAATTVPTAVNPMAKAPATGAHLTAVQASTELAQGRNRFAVGLIRARNQPVIAGNVRVEYFKLLTNGSAEKRADASAVFRSVGGARKGIWGAPATFPETGSWGAQGTLQPPNDTAKVARVNFDVRPKISAPGYQDAAGPAVAPAERGI